MKMRKLQGTLVVIMLAVLLTVFTACISFAAEVPVLKIGVLGVMTGPAASWGLVCKYCAEANAQMYNEQGGAEIDGTKYKIEVISIDDKADPKLAVSGMERLVYQEKIKYIIGPNVDTTAASVIPVIEAAGAIDIPYCFNKTVYSPPHGNSILGQIASYQSGPIVYKYMMQKHNVKSIAFVARNEADPLNQRKEGMEAAKALGLKVVSWEDTYEPGATDFFPVMTKVIRGNPDQIVLSGASPVHCPQLIKAARELGYKGYLSTEVAQDIKPMNEIAGKYAEGFITVGGASTPEIQSDFMGRFIEVYKKVAGEWNDEAGTKVYALPMIIFTLQKAGKAALTDVEVFKKAIPSVAVKNPFVKEEKTLRYVGKSYFGQLRQIGVPMVVTTVKNGQFQTLFVETVD
jgi:branched-chain amino acid transport system substrate-binding protein